MFQPEFPEASNLDSLEPTPLIDCLLMKTVDEGDKIKFHGIASDETPDEVGDTILRKSIDLTYASSRGYVNWEHSRAPEDQIGFLRKAILIDDSNRSQISEEIGTEVPETATVYVSGELYPGLDRSIAVGKLLKAAGDSSQPLGISLDGSVARDRNSGGVVRAYVRGVALTSKPAHQRTMARLAKSMSAFTTAISEGYIPSDLPKEIATTVVELLKNAEVSKGIDGLSRDEAVLFVLKNRPRWSYELANKLVQYTIQANQGD